MMGELSPDQNTLFYEFCLEHYVPQDHLLRKIDPLPDLSALRKSLSPFYSHTGRPSIDPEVMLHMLIVGYCYGIRSERRLCEEVHPNLAYRWFCRRGLEGKVPDHSTFSENRHGRFRDSDVLRKLFESVLQRCMSEGLVGGEGFAVDASLVKADASHQRQREDDDDWGDGRAVREYPEALDEGSAQVGASGRRISPTDPAASYTAAHRAKGVYAYSSNYLVDIRHGIIMDTEATPANLAREVDSTRHMTERVERRFGITPQRLIGDTAYGTAPCLAGWLRGSISRRMCRSGTRPGMKTAPSLAVTFSGMLYTRNIDVPPVSDFAPGNAISPSWIHLSRRPITSSTVQASQIVGPVA